MFARDRPCGTIFGCPSRATLPGQYYRWYKHRASLSCLYYISMTLLVVAAAPLLPNLDSKDSLLLFRREYVSSNRCDFEGFTLAMYLRSCVDK